MSKVSVVHVDGVRYPVREGGDGIIKADLSGRNGWQSVWARSYTDLVIQIRRALRARWLVPSMGR